MATRSRGKPLDRVGAHLRRGSDDAFEVDRLDDKYRASVEATEQWRSLLREMEASGESSDPKYERYFRAYVDAQQQEKRIDLELFNRRQGLVD